MNITTIIFFSLMGTCSSIHAQAVIETGSGKMPAEWIDKDTHHHLIRLTSSEGSNSSFYFNNNPFTGDKMVYYNSIGKSKQLYSVTLKTGATEKLTSRDGPLNGEIVCAKTGETFYQVKDSVFCTNVNNKKTRLVYVFPSSFKASVITVNADASLLAGVWSTDAEKEIQKNNPEKRDYFDKIFEAKLPRTMFTINTHNGKLKKIFTDSAWLNHLLFSPTDPSLLMFCHEGPWHKVNRIWTMNLLTGKITLMHKRTLLMEIAGHEWFAPDGKTIWFDLQKPRGETFFVAGADVQTGAERTYQLTRNEWSIHFNISPDQQLFCGDGGDEGQVAKAKDGMWLYLFKPEGDHFVSEKLVNMKHHDYKLEPNVHFSPDGKWVIFRANFEGMENVYEVAVNK